MAERRYTMSELKNELRAMGFGAIARSSTDKQRASALEQRLARYRKLELLNEPRPLRGERPVGRPGKTYSHDTLLRLAYILDRRGTEPNVSNAVLRKALAAGEHRRRFAAAPALPGSLYFFLLCSSDEHAHVLRALQPSMVDGAYYVCGSQPWLLVVRAAHASQLHNLALDNLTVVHMLQTASAEDTERLNEEPVDRSFCWRSFIELQFGHATAASFASSADHAPAETAAGKWPGPQGEFLKWLRGIRSEADGAGYTFLPLTLHRVVGGRTLVLEVLCRNAQDLFALIREFATGGVATTTKCVLATLKHGGERQPDPALQPGEAEPAPSPAQESFEYALQIALHNHGDHLLAARAKQNELFESVVKRGAKRVFPERIAQVVRDLGAWLPAHERTEDAHPLAEVDRIQLAVRAKGWVRVLLFIKSRLGRLPELENKLLGLLSVERHYCALKLMRCAGPHDFIIPVDCEDAEETASELIRSWKETKDIDALIDDEIRQVAVRPLDGPQPARDAGGDRGLSDLAIDLIRRFTDPTCSLEQFERDVRGLEQFVSDPADTVESPWLGKLYELYAEPTASGAPATPADVARRLRSLLSYWPGPSAPSAAGALFEALGLRPQVELGPALQHALVRLQLRDEGRRIALLAALHKRRESNTLAAEIYQPIHSPGELMLSVRYRDFSELEQLMNEAQTQYCRRTSFAVIFSQLYYAHARGKPTTGRRPART